MTSSDMNSKNGEDRAEKRLLLGVLRKAESDQPEITFDDGQT